MIEQRIDRVMAGIDNVSDVDLISVPGVVMKEFRDRITQLEAENAELIEASTKTRLQLVSENNILRTENATLYEKNEKYREILGYINECEGGKELIDEYCLIGNIRLDNIREENTALREENRKLERIICRVVEGMDDLIEQSNGVCGLHLNGDVALWEEIAPPGHYGEWLQWLEDARRTLLKQEETFRNKLFNAIEDAGATPVDLPVPLTTEPQAEQEADRE